MKKLIFTFLIICLGFHFASAQTSPSDSLQQYVGTYKVKDSNPFATYKVKLVDGHLTGEADDYGANKLVKKPEADKFQSTSSYGSIITFTRNSDKKINGLKMEIQGTELEATKE